MSQESITWLNDNTLIGFTAKRGTAWHWRQGTDNHFPGAVPMERVESLLDLTFSEEPLWIGLGETKQPGGSPANFRQVPGKKAIVRQDNQDVLGIFGDGYTVHPYQEWLVDNVATILDADLQVGSAGLLKRGGQAWVQVEMEETQVAAGVEFRPFLTAATSVDGSLSSTYNVGAQAVVCDNTLSMALGSKASQQVKIRHSRNSLGRVSEVRDVLGILWEASSEFQAEVDRLTSDLVSDRAWDEFVKAHSGLVVKGTALTPDDGRSFTIASKKADTLRNLWAADPRVAPWQGTAYGVLAAVNTSRQHLWTVRGMERAERMTSNFITGRTQAEDRAALDLLAKVTA